MLGKKQGASGVALGVGMALVALVLGAAPFWAGGLYITMHEGDTLHLADLVLRMSQAGQVPHLDFMTPIGIGALWPIAAFSKMGLGLGHAFLAAQAAVAAALFVPIWRVASSRFSGGLAWLFAVYVLALCLALISSGVLAAASVSMHYNRWAWAMAYVAVPLAMLEPLGPRRPGLDGALIGLMMAGMALVKVTYFAGFAPAVVVALLARRDFTALGVAVLTGALVAAAVTAVLGTEFWLAYLRDLLSVAGSENRSAPGDSFAAILGAPKYVAGTMVLLAGVIFVRQAGALAEGLALLLLTPAFLYVTYQNFGNDPQWLVLLALLALHLRPKGEVTNGLGWRMREALLVVGAVALGLGAGSALNLVWSPLRHAVSDTENTVALLGARPVDADVLVKAPRVYKVVETVRGDGPGSPFASYSTKAVETEDDAGKKPADPAALNGESLPDCELTGGSKAWFETVAADLQGAGYGGSKVLIADLFSALWLYGDFIPVPGAAPWYYSGVPGVAEAEHVLVPMCATSQAVRSGYLKAVEAAGWRLEEERRTPVYILLKPVRD